MAVLIGGSLSSIKWLVEHGAEINASNNGITPFEMAIMEGRVDVTDYLISIGGGKPGDGYSVWRETAGLSMEDFRKNVAENPGDITQEPQESQSNIHGTENLKTEITKSIERLELLEEKFGIAISALYASYEYDAEYAYAHRVRINFDLISLNGGQLERNFKLFAGAYNSAGQLLETDATYIVVDDFMGIKPISITLALDQAPDKIRLFPAR